MLNGGEYILRSSQDKVHINADLLRQAQKRRCCGQKSEVLQLGQARQRIERPLLPDKAESSSSSQCCGYDSVMFSSLTS